jgi:hypothetical protein
VVALREPLGEEAARDIVRAYVAAFEREDLDGLEQLLTNDAVSLDTRSRGSRSAILDGWRARMKQLEYARIAGSEVVALDRIERYEIDDFEAQGAPPRPAEMRAGDVLVRAPVSTPRIGGDRFFGDTIVMLLRRQEGGRFKIAGIGEEGGP